VGPFFPFQPLHFLFSRYSQVAPNVQKISRSTKDLVFGKMREGLNKEEVERISKIGRDK
jgi:tRNA C32,U32 (ribose-2'-O)-methylase TrmJ